MNKRLIALSLALLLSGGAVTAIAAGTSTAQPSAKPLLLAQNTAPAPRGRALKRPAPTEAERASRRTEACENLSALAAGRLAYMEARLNLTPAQRTAFTRWRDVRLASAKRMAATCANEPMPGPRRARGQQPADATPPSPVERMARQEARLRARIADLTAERPALEALYNSLTPEQRQKFRPEQGGPRGGMGAGPRGPRMAMMMRRGGEMGPRGGMMRGGPGGAMGLPMGPPPGDAPPAQ